LKSSRGLPKRTKPRAHARFAVYPRQDKQAYAGMGFPGASAASGDRYALRLLSAVLGMGMSSRLFQEVRERSGLVYEIFSSSHSYTDCGSVSIFYNTASKDQARVAHLTAKEMRKLKEEGLEDGELDRAKNMLNGAYVRRLESSSSRMFRLAEGFMSSGEAISPEETTRRIAAVTEEDVMKAASKYLKRGALAMALHAPKKESDGAVKDLEGLDF